MIASSELNGCAQTGSRARGRLARNGERGMVGGAKVIAASAVMLLAVQAAVADTYTYTPAAGANDVWSLGTNWDVTPVSASSTELTFGGPNTTVMGEGLTDTNTNDIGVFSLNILDLQGTGPTTTPAVITIASAAGNSLNFVSDVAGPVVNLNANSGTATLTYNVTSAITLGSNISFTGDGSAIFNFSGPIGGAASLSKSGLSALTLSGTNTFGGVGQSVTLNAGTLNIGSASALGDANNALVINGGNIDNTSGAALALAAPYAQTWGGDFTFLGSQSLDMGAGAVSLGANAGTVRTVTVNNSTLTVGGVIADGTTVNTLAKAGGGTLVLTGANTYDGGTNLGGGTLSFASGSLGTAGTIAFTGNSTLQWNGANTQDLSARMMINDGITATIDTAANNVTFATALQTGALGTGGLTKAGSGTLTVTAANTYTGTTTIAGGTIFVSNGQALGPAGNLIQMSNNSATLDLAVDSGLAAYNISMAGATNGTIVSDRATSGPGFTQALGTLTISNSALVTNAGANVSGGTPAISFASTVVTGSAPSFNPGTALLNLGNVTSANNSSIILGSSNTGLNTVGAINIGTGTVTKAGSGSWTITGAGTYTGNTNLNNNGILFAANAQAFGNSNSVILAGCTLDITLDSTINPYNVSIVNNALIISDKLTPGTAGITQQLGNLSMVNASLNVTAGANVTGGAPAVAFNAVTITGNVTYNPTTASLTLASVSSAANNTVTLNGTATGNTIGNISIGTGTVTRNNAGGVWTFNGGSTYSGATVLNSGISAINADSTPTSGTITSGPFGTGILSLKGGTLTSVGAAHTIANITQLGTSSTIAGSQNLTINGLLSTQGSGLTLTVSNTGGSTVNFAGGFGIRGDSMGTNRSVTINGAGNIQFGGAVTDGIAGTSGSNLAYTGSGTLTFSGKNIYSGNSTFTGNGLGASTTANVVLDGTTGGSMAGTLITIGNGTNNMTVTVKGNYAIGTSGTSKITVTGGDGLNTGQGTLSLLDGTSNTLTISAAAAGATDLAFSSGTAKSNLKMDLGDTITLTNTGKYSVAAGGLNLTLNGIGGLGYASTVTDTLITAPGNTAALSTSLFSLTNTGNFGGYTTATLSTTATTLVVTLGNQAATPGTAYWTGTQNGVWNSLSGGTANNSNWATDLAGTASLQLPSATSNVVFSVTSGGTNLSTTLGADTTVNSLEFNSAADSAHQVTISGNTLTISASGANNNVSGNGITVDSGAGAETINSNVTLAAAQTWTVNNDPSAPLTINGTIHDGGFGVVKAGSGTLALGGANAFTGGLTINAGTVRLTSTSALNTTTPQAVTFGAGAAAGTRLQLNGNSVTSGALASDSATPNNPIIENASGNAATLTVAQNTDSNYYGVLQDGVGGGALNLVKTGTGALTLSGANVHTGTTTVGSGSLLINGSLSSASAVSVTANADLATATLGGTGTINGAVTINTPTGSGRTNQITGAGVGTIGTLTLNNGLTLNSGSVGYFDILDNGANDLINITAGGLTASAGTIIRVSSGLTTSDTYHLIDFTGAAPTLSNFTLQNFTGNNLPGNYSLNVTANSLDLVIATAAAKAAPDITILTPISGIRVMKSTSVGISGNVTNAGTVNLNATLADNAGDLAVSNFSPTGTFTVPTPNGSVPYTATIADTGTTLGTRTFSVKVSDPDADPTSVAASSSLVVLDNRVVSSSNAPNFGLVHVGAAVTAATNLTSPGSDDNYTRVTVANGADANGIAVSGGSTTTQFNGSFTDTRTISGNITGLGTVNGAITLLTTGEAGLAGQSPNNVTVNYTAQVFSGKAAWNVAAGGNWNVDGNWADTAAPDIGGIGAPGLSGALSSGDTAMFGDLAGTGTTTIVNLNGATPSLAGINFSATSTSYTLTGTVGLNLQLAATPIDVLGTHTIATVLGGLGFNKTNSGTLILAGTAANTYTGATTVSNGILELTAADNRLPTTTSLILGDAVNNTSGKVILGDGTTARNQSVAALSTAGTGTVNSVVGSAATNSTLTVNGSASTTFAGTLGGAGLNENNLNLTKNGTGTLVLTGNNTYIGTTTLTGGELGLGSANAIGTTGPIVFNAGNVGGTLQFSAANTTDISSTGRINTAITNQAFSFDTNGQTVTFAGSLPGFAATLSKTGAGMLIVNPGVFTGVGATSVSGGVLQELGGLGNSVKLALSGTSSVYGVFQTNGDYTGFGANAPFLLGNSLTWAANAGFAAKGGQLTITLDFGNAETWGTNSFLGSGTDALVFGSTTADSQVVLTNDINLNTTDSFQRVIYVEKGVGGDSALLSGVLSGGTAVKSNTGINKTGPGILILSGTNTYQGVTIVTAGTLVVATNAPTGGAPGAFGTGSGASDLSTGTQYTVQLGNAATPVNGTASIVIDGAYSVDRPITVNSSVSSATFTLGSETDNNASFTGAITINQPLNFTQVATTGTHALNVTGGIAGIGAGTKNVNFNNIGAVNVSTGVIADGGGKIAVVQNGPGVTTVSSQNTYSGGTTVNGGTFLVTNTGGSATGSAGVTLNGGTLGGSGIITGAVSGGSGAHTIFPSATLSSTSVTTLTIGSLTTNSNSTLQFNLVTPLKSAAGGSDMINVNGDLTLGNGTTLNVSNHASGTASLGYYEVMQYTGTLSLGTITLPASEDSGHVVYTLSTTQNPGFVDIHRGFEGDADDNGLVDINDLSVLATNWQKPGGWSQGNFLGDPVVDINDLSVLATNWQGSIGTFETSAFSLPDTPLSFQQAVASISFGASPVPEPTSLALLGMGAAALLARRRRR